MEIPPRCGDGEINGDDQCDGEQLGGKSCKSLGLAGGELSCGQDCKLDTSGCSWSFSAGSVADELGRALALDAQGNSYVAGSFTGPMVLGSTTLISRGDRDILVARLDPGGKVRWAAALGGASRDVANAVSLDGTGNLLVTGYFSGSARFGSVTLSSRGGKDVFVARLDPQGKLLWAAGLGGSEDDEGLGLAADSNGRCYVSGRFAGSVNFGSVQRKANGGEDLFVVRLDPQGKVLWSLSAGGSGDDAAAAVALDGKGQLLLTGDILGKVKIGARTLDAEVYHDVLVARLTPEGKVAWAISGGSPDSDAGFQIAADQAGNSYVTGYFRGGQATFGAHTLSNSSKGKDEAFLIKVGPQSKVHWAVSAGGSAGDYGDDVAVDSGGVYWTGDLISVAARPSAARR